MRNSLDVTASSFSRRRGLASRMLDFVQATALALLLLLVAACAAGCAASPGAGASPDAGAAPSEAPADQAGNAASAPGDAAAREEGSADHASEGAGAAAGEPGKSAEVGQSAEPSATEAPNRPSEESHAAAEEAPSEAPDPDALFEALGVTEDYRKGFVHGEKPAEYQRYIVLHDTEGGDSAANVIDWWDSNGNLVAAHFIVNKDGSIWQCVPLDKIAHHAGFGDTGHNVAFGTNNESRDDKKGTTPIGDDFADYGMNSYSVGIEMVHRGGEGDYPEAQLEAVDALIAYIDAYYGFESQIIDHKTWRSGNSDTSEEFAKYLKSYQEIRTHE